MLFLHLSFGLISVILFPILPLIFFLCSSFPLSSLHRLDPHLLPIKLHELLVLDAENSPSSVVQWKNSAHREQSIEWEHHKLGVLSAQPQTFVRGLVELLQFDDSLGVHGDVNQFIFCARRLAQPCLCNGHVTAIGLPQVSSPGPGPPG